MKYISVVLLCAALVLLTVNPEPTPLSRNVVITDAEGSGSGVIVKTNWVLTNAHVVANDIKVNNQMCKVMAKNEVLDLALVMTNTAEFPMVKFGSVKAGDEVFYVGNPGGHVNLISKGHVLYLDFSHVTTNTMPIGGMSGGGLYNKRGQLVGLNVGMEGLVRAFTPMSVHIPVWVIEAFLKENMR